MANSNIHVLARVIGLPDKVDEVKTILLTLIEPTRQEVGCLRYELWQNQDDPTDFNWVEEWKNQASLDSHLSSSHFKKANSKLIPLLATEPVIRFYQLVA